MLFWWPVIGVWPSQSVWPKWAMIPYLVLADVVNTGLSAVLCFSDHVLYPTYQSVPRLWGISAISDQVTAGAIMWVPGSIVFLAPAVVLIMQIAESGRFHGIKRTAGCSRGNSAGSTENSLGSFAGTCRRAHPSA